MTILKISDNHEDAIKGLIKELGIADTLSTRTMIAESALGYGIMQLSLSYGVMLGLLEQRPTIRLSDKPREDTPSQEIIPLVCPSCGVQVLRQPSGKIACNCKVWKK